MRKLKNASDEIRDIHMRRLAAVRENGYLIAHLPEEGSSAYEQMVRATQEYRKASLTPAEERVIHELIGSTTVDYEHREIHPTENYTIASVVFPVRDPSGDYTMTLRLSQLPQHVPGSTVTEWIDRCQEIIRDIEHP